MPRFRPIQLTALSLVAIGLLAAGCGKRPATTQTAAPAPTGQTATTPPAGPRAGTPAVPAPATPGPSGAPSTPPGRPETRPTPREFVAVPDVKDVHFDFDKYDVRPDDARILDDSARWMKVNPGHLILVEGHADERGTNEYNLALGERRAKAAMNYLVAQAVQAARVTIISYGEERPTCAEKTEACWARNPRAYFLVKPQ